MHVAAGGQDLTSAPLPASTGRARAARRDRAPTTTGASPHGDATDQLDQLRFLHEVAQLATTARTWDELLETVVDGTRDALHADVSSLYLLDRDGAYLTLAATNGLDRYQIGRARVPFGEGVTATSPRTATPLVIPDVNADPRFLWVRGIDQRRFVASMLQRAARLARPDRRRAQRPDRGRRATSATTTSPSSARSPTCSPASSRRAASRREAEARVEALKADRRGPQRAHRPRDP